MQAEVIQGDDVYTSVYHRCSSHLQGSVDKEDVEVNATSA